MFSIPNHCDRPSVAWAGGLDSNSPSPSQQRSSTSEGQGQCSVQDDHGILQKQNPTVEGKGLWKGFLVEVTRSLAGLSVLL